MLKKILIVDDEADVVEALETRLKAQNYSVILARSGREALAKVKETRPDLIILDIMMPGMDGTEVGHVLKNDKSTKDTPIIFLTALQTKKDEEKGAEIGRDTVFAKPFEFHKLLAKIKQLIG